jgi:hypothetical protein
VTWTTYEDGVQTKQSTWHWCDGENSLKTVPISYGHTPGGSVGTQPPRPKPTPAPTTQPAGNPCASMIGGLPAAGQSGAIPSTQEMATDQQKVADITAKVSVGSFLIGMGTWLFPQFKIARSVGAVAFEISEAAGIMTLVGRGNALWMDFTQDNAAKLGASAIGYTTGAVVGSQLGPKTGGLLDPATQSVLSGMAGLGAEAGAEQLQQSLLNPVGPCP